MFLTTRKKIFTPPERGIFNQKALLLHANLSWNIFFWIDISAANAILMLFSNWNDCFEMKQFGMNQYLFPNAKMWSDQNAKTCHLCNPRSQLEEHFFLYKHIHIAYLKHFMLFIPKQNEKRMSRYWKTEMQRIMFYSPFSWLILIRLMNFLTCRSEVEGRKSSLFNQ